MTWTTWRPQRPHAPWRAPHSRRSGLRWHIAVLATLAVAVTACTTEPVPTDDPAAPTQDDAAAEDDTSTADDVEGNEDAEATTDEPPPADEQPVASGDGTATATVGGESYELRIIHCFVDAVSPLVGEEVAFIMDGVPLDAPDDAVEPLRGLLSAEDIEELDEERMRELTQPVLAHGPLLSVARLADDGESDVMSLQFADGTVYQTDFGGFLEISGDGPGATVTGTAEATAVNIEDPDAEAADPGPISLEATCP